MDQGVGCVESFPCCGGVAIAVDDPALLRQQIAVRLEVLIVRHSLAALPELQFVNDEKRQPRDLGQLPSQGRFSSACVSEYGHAFHGRCITTPNIVRLRAAAFNGRGYRASG
jgi:hypothetical protein